MRVIGKSTNVIIKPETVEKKIGSIIIPETASEKKYKWGIIESIGDLGGDEVAIKDRVLYKMNGVNKVNEGKEDELHIVPYESLLFWRS